MEFKETFKRYPFGLKQITFLGQPDSRWLLKQSNLSKHRTGYNSVHFTYTKLKFSEVVAEIVPQIIHRVLTNLTKTLFKPLPITIGINRVC